jgi:hypothetical protein
MFGPPLTLGHGCGVLLMFDATTCRCQRLIAVLHGAE